MNGSFLTSRKKGPKIPRNVPHGKVNPAWLLLGCGILFSAFLLTQILQYSQNTLLLNGRWIVEKRMLKMAVMGADNFLMSRSPLSGNELNLGDWFGYQEVILKDPVIPTEVRFKFQVPKDSYLDFLFDGKNNIYSGMRFATNGRFAPRIFTRDLEGQFLSVKNISLPFTSPGWHAAKILNSGNDIALRIDGGDLILMPDKKFYGGKIGFSAGENGAMVDDLEIWQAGKLLVKDSFKNSKNTLTTFLGNLALMVLITFLIFALCRWAHLEAINYQNLFILFFSALLGVCFCFDYFFWSKLPLQAEMRFLVNHTAVPLILPEKIRHDFFSRWANSAGYDLDFREQIKHAGYPSEMFGEGPFFCSARTNHCAAYADMKAVAKLAKTRACKRIIFLGTSQTVGSGADTLEDTFFAKVHSGLVEALAPECVESLNISISGMTLADLIPVLEKALSQFPPDLVLMNLSNNDAGSNTFPNLSLAVGLNRRAGADTVLVEEANDSVNIGLLKNHEIMKQIGERNNLPVFPLHACLNTPEVAASGVLWWDHVHLTTYGQAVAAHWLLRWLSPSTVGKVGPGEAVPKPCQLPPHTRRPNLVHAMVASSARLA
jgi:lysophospholipase L1-like esterase